MTGPGAYCASCAVKLKFFSVQCHACVFECVVMQHFSTQVVLPCVFATAVMCDSDSALPISVVSGPQCFSLLPVRREFC